MIDETSAVPYVVTNNFHPQPHIHVKSDRGLKFLRETLSLKKYDKNVELDPIINPESKAILHKIRQNCEPAPFKAKILSTAQLLSLTDTTKMKKIEKKTKFVRHEKLFKNEEE